ncbi:hypothetical protein [Mangrovibrevibacter kandeliae]|uniref:hypothetical protein n=1 Tax=Mangrovibrevibacter kandeliae TaxID=2968473 RepID=UPI00211845AB|nr:MULTISPECIES: hypothetical protein [unclassified Aurantimonas]MCQ8782141.1 hypothetical protein [Aurantimonas sp. CSK15Z-1]MCW4115200.1 hypothetical protein [Aurantimonas sp. MSK8Z-1]
MQDPHCHSSSIAVDRPAETAFEIMAEGLSQGRWTLGSYDRRQIEPGLFVGTSLFSGRETYVRLHVDRERFVVDYDVGPSPDALSFRNMSRVIPGAVLNMPPGSCVVTLLSWRRADQSEAAWMQTSTSHEAEMFLIKGLLER